MEASTATSSKAIDVRGVDFVMVPVEDLRRAATFYGNVLGLEAGKLWGRDLSSAVGAEFETGTVTIALMDVAKVGNEFRTGGGAIALHVGDVAASRDRLADQGVDFVAETIDSGVCHQAIFRDTEGNTLILHTRYAPPAS